MSAFTFADFLVFSGATNINEDSYSTVAKGVLNYIKQHYGIYPETETIALKVFLTSGQLSVTPKVYPIQNVYRVWYDDDLVSDTDYSYYGEDILFTTAFDDIRKPLTLELDVGFDNSVVPDDLILTIYRHIIAVYHAIDKHSDNILKSVNSDGNTTFFNQSIIPPACRHVYEFYAGHTLLLN